MKYKIIALYFLLFIAAKLDAQNIAFDHINVKNGLVEGTVMDIMQDNDGYMWFATQNGVVRYDGYDLKTYKPGSDIKGSFPDYRVVKVTEDDIHNLWALSTTIGVLKYDRTNDHFVPVEKDNKKDFHNYQSMVKDESNCMWVLESDAYLAQTSSTVKRVNLTTGQSTTYSWTGKGSHHLATKSLNQIYYIKNSGIWLTTQNGVYKYDAGKDKFTAALPAFAADTTAAYDLIYQQPSFPAQLWLTRSRRNSKLNTASYELLKYDFKKNVYKVFVADSTGIIKSQVTAIYQDKRNRLWLSSLTGLNLYNPASGSFVNYPYLDTASKVNKLTVTNILATRQGTLWLGTDDQGLFGFDPAITQFSHAAYASKNNPAGLISRGVSTAFVDRNNTLWVGHGYWGIDHENAAQSAITTCFGGQFAGGFVDNIVQDAQGIYWIASYNGLYRYDRLHNAVRAIPLITGKGRQPVIYPMLLTKNRLLYCGSVYDGIFIYDMVKGRVIRRLQINNETGATPGGGDYVWRFLDDGNGTIWMGTTDRGMFAYNPVTGRFKPYPYINNNEHLAPPDKLDDNFVMSIRQDRSGKLWVGTNIGGLNYYNKVKDRFTSVFDPYSAMSAIKDIFQDQAGKLWMGTYFSGLFQVNSSGKITRRFTENDGLLYENITGIQQDNQGYLWLQSPRGLSRLDTRNYAIKNYSGQDYPPLANLVGEQGILKNSDGQLMFACENDVAVLDPSRLPVNPISPIVHVESVSWQNPGADKPVVTHITTYERNNTILPWNQNQLTFNYVALNYIDAKRNEYAYRLEGYEKAWVQAGARRNVTYSNLPPGAYTFHVIAANSDGIWNKKGDSFTIIINPPWWFTWWALSLYGILFAAAVYFFIAYRSRKLKQQNLILEEKIEERTKQLSDANQELNEQREEITIQRDDLSSAISELRSAQTQLIQSEKMASLGELTAGIAHEIQNPLNFVNNFSEVSQELVDEMEGELKKGDTEEALYIASSLKENLEKIHHHGKRADSIVKGMLEHSRTSAGRKESTDLNKLADEYLRLAYHGLRAKDKTFNAELVTHFDPELPRVNVSQQDMGRVMLNLFNNAFYAVSQKQKTAGTDYKAEVTVITASDTDHIIIKVRDNGNGIPDAIKDKIMQPFFTTKPTGQGTGLGLSLAYDIVVKGHGGKIEVDTKAGEGSEFRVVLPIAGLR
jgi:signal transduction histidine kinase/ligand-binding sensor domain-containing protein